MAALAEPPVSRDVGAGAAAEVVVEALGAPRGPSGPAPDPGPAVGLVGAADAWGELGTEVGPEVGPEAALCVGLEVRAEVWPEAWPVAWPEAGVGVGLEVGAGVRASVGLEVGAEVGAGVGVFVGGLVDVPAGGLDAGRAAADPGLGAEADPGLGAAAGAGLGARLGARLGLPGGTARRRIGAGWARYPVAASPEDRPDCRITTLLADQSSRRATTAEPPPPRMRAGPAAATGWSARTAPLTGAASLRRASAARGTAATAVVARVRASAPGVVVRRTALANLPVPLVTPTSSCHDGRGAAAIGAVPALAPFDRPDDPMTAGPPDIDSVAAAVTSPADVGTPARRAGALVTAWAEVVAPPSVLRRTVVDPVAPGASSIPAGDPPAAVGEPPDAASGAEETEDDVDEPEVPVPGEAALGAPERESVERGSADPGEAAVGDAGSAAEATAAADEEDGGVAALDALDGPAPGGGPSAWVDSVVLARLTDVGGDADGVEEGGADGGEATGDPADGPPVGPAGCTGDGAGGGVGATRDADGEEVVDRGAGAGAASGTLATWRRTACSLAWSLA